jgi:hypothetical protein
MQRTPEMRLADLMGDLIALSIALAQLHQDTDLHPDTNTVTSTTLAKFEHFENALRFERLTNNLRDGWRLTEASGGLGLILSPMTAEEELAAAPFARLLKEADNLVQVSWDFDEPDPATGANLYCELRHALASTVAALADLIADLVRGRVTLPPFLDGDELAAAEAEADAFPAAAKADANDLPPRISLLTATARRLDAMENQMAAAAALSAALANADAAAIAAADAAYVSAVPEYLAANLALREALRAVHFDSDALASANLDVDDIEQINSIADLAEAAAAEEAEAERDPDAWLSAKLAERSARMPFGQAFAELAGVMEGSQDQTAASDETAEIERLDAVTLAFDKLPQLDPHRVTDLLQKSAALAALAGAAAAELQVAAERKSDDRQDINLTLAVTARAELRSALERIAALLDQGRP